VGRLGRLKTVNKYRQVFVYWPEIPTCKRG